MPELPDVKLRALVIFPVSVTGRTGMAVEKISGRYYLDIDLSGLVQNDSISGDQIDQSWMLIWNSTTDAYELVPYALAATAGVASLDGQTGPLSIGYGLKFTGATLDVVTTFETQTQLAARALPASVSGVHLLGASSVGDDGDAILKKVATPAIIKPWHKPADGSWTELMGSVGSLKFFGGKSDGSTGNISANNQALKDIAQWAQERREAGQSTEMTFHGGIYDYDDNDFNLAQINAVLRSVGQPILRYHGTSYGLVLDGEPTVGPPLVFGRTGFKMLGQLTVQSNSAALDAIVARAMLQDSVLDLKCGGGSASHAGLRLEFGVCPDIRYTCSSNLADENGDPWWADGVAPLYGLYATGIGLLSGNITPVSYSSLQPIIEGVPYGAWLEKCNGMQIHYGTIEGCSITGLTINTGCIGNNVFGTDFEANTSFDVYCVGSDNNFFGINCGGVFSFGTADTGVASRNRIHGGCVNSLIFNAGTAYNQADTTFNTAIGTLSDFGTYNRTKGCFDAGNAQYYQRAEVPLTLSGSPYEFQNTTGDNLMVFVISCTVSSIEIKPLATGSYISLGETSGRFELAPKDQLRITYSVAPVVATWGL